MAGFKQIARGLLATLALAGPALSATADELRNIKKGEEVPSFQLPTAEGKLLISDKLDGNVVVLVYLSAEQKSSEQAATDSWQVVEKFEEEPVRLVHVTADVVHKPYFEKLREEHEIQAPLALDAQRRLYGELGLIVFPTTIVTDKEGKLAHVISTRGPEYPRVLEAYIRHALGEIAAPELEEILRARGSDIGSPRSLAARHRAAARLLREKGLVDDARAELVRAIEYDPEDANIKLDLADIDLSTGNEREALELTSEVLSEQPEHRRAKQIAGIAMFKLGDYEQARTMLTESLVLNPDPARAMYYLGRIEQMEGNAQEALKHYREAAEHLLDETP